MLDRRIRGAAHFDSNWIRGSFWRTYRTQAPLRQRRERNHIVQGD